MRAEIVACSVAGTLSSATSVVEMYAPVSPTQHSTLGEFTHDLLSEKRVTGGPAAIVSGSPATDGSRAE